MAVDVGADLLKKITNAFAKKYDDDITISVLEARLASEKATLEDAMTYAERVGEILANVYQETLSSSVLPNGKMYWNIAQKVIKEPLVNNYTLTANASMQAVDATNKRYGVNIKAQKPTLGSDRISNIANKVVQYDSYDDAAYMLGEPVKNFSRSVVDDTVHENADFQAKAGVDVKIVRTMTGRETCDWCRARAGTYKYENVRDTGNDVWQRHDYCDCRIEYVSSKESYDIENFKKTDKRKRDVAVESDRAPEKVAVRRELAGITDREQLSELGVFSKRLLSDKKIDTKYYQAVRSKFSHGSNEAKKVFNKFVPQSTVSDYKYLGIPNLKSGKIRLNWQEDIDGVRGPCVTWFHEHGHLIDAKAGYLSHDKEFYMLLEQDYNKIIEDGKRYGATDDFVFDALGRKLSSMRKHSAVSDIMGALSKNRVSGCAGHKTDYWASNDVVAEEAFAHMFEAQFDDVRYKEMKQYFPNALKYFEQKLEVAGRD